MMKPSKLLTKDNIDHNSPKAKIVLTLHNQFKEGMPSSNFIERTRQLGADRFFLTTADGRELQSDSDSKRFGELHTAYIAQLDGRAQSNFPGYDLAINFKQGKVTKSVFWDVFECEITRLCRAVK